MSHAADFMIYFFGGDKSEQFKLDETLKHECLSEIINNCQKGPQNWKRHKIKNH